MTTCSEDVLLQVSNVKHKKGEGTLYVMSERIAFILQDSETVSISHLYTDIKTQKISSDFKTKVQLQVVMHDGATSTFQFVKPDRTEAMKDRDKIKDILFKLLPKFQKKVNKELEEKNRILSENPALLQLYRDLVITQVITPEEFWTQHAPRYAPKNANNGQTTGVPANFLVNIRPQTDGGCNSVKYNLSLETINCIFKTYPAVRRKHTEYVPHKMTEADFWRRFFESHYFHKDRMPGAGDIFAECAKYDDQEARMAAMELRADDPVNLTTMDDMETTDGYGVLEEDSKSSNIVHESIVKRFNRHSINVLRTGLNAESNVTVSNEPVRHDRPDAYADLRSQSVDATCDGGSTGSNGAKLARVEQMANELTRRTTSSTTRKRKLERAELMRERATAEMSRWAANGARPVTVPVHPSLAVQALGELTPGGSLMKGLLEDGQTSQPVDAAVATELSHLYTASGELLRHFWACFPPTSAALEEKLTRTHDALRRFHSTRVARFEEQLTREHSHLRQRHITSHLGTMLNAAYAKYAAWQCRRKPHS